MWSLFSDIPVNVPMYKHRRGQGLHTTQLLFLFTSPFLFHGFCEYVPMHVNVDRKKEKKVRVCVLERERARERERRN
jgi:hypothetical protein